MRHIILNFHGIGVNPIEREPGEANYWITSDFYDEILVRVQHYRDRVRTTLTFDDGNRSDLLIGAEALAKCGMKASFFVLAGRIGDAHSLSEDEIRALAAMGHEIGNHGAEHVDWTTLDETGFEVELGYARSKIAEITGIPITSAAIPFGRYNKRVLKELRSRGYTRFYSSDGGGVTSQTMPFPRTSVRANMTLEEIDLLLTGQELVVHRLRRPLARLMKRWL